PEDAAGERAWQLEEVVLLHGLGAGEEGVAAESGGGFEQDGIQGVAGMVGVAAVSQRRLPVPMRQRTVVAGRGGEAALVGVRGQLLGALQEAVADLQSPVGRWVEAEAGRPGTQAQRV